MEIGPQADGEEVVLQAGRLQTDGAQVSSAQQNILGRSLEDLAVGGSYEDPRRFREVPRKILG